MRIIETTKCRSAGAWWLLLLLGAPMAPVPAATPAWRAEVARGGDEGFGSFYYNDAELPARDGFWLVGYAADGASTWIARHATDGSRIGLHRFHGPVGNAVVDSRGALVLRTSPVFNDSVVTAEDCVVDRGPLGAPRAVVSLDPEGTGGDGGVIEAGTLIGAAERSAELYRTQRDCRIAPLPAIGRDAITDVRNIPGAAAAYVLAGDSSYRSDELLRVDATGVRWRVPLAALRAEARAARFEGVDAGGIGLVVAGEAGASVVRVRSDGSIAWRRDLERQNVAAWNPTPLLVHYASTSVDPLDIEALDLQTGATLFSRSLPAGIRGRLDRLRSARDDGGWRLARYGGGDGALVLDVQSSGSARVRWRGDGDMRAAAELSDGSLLIATASGDFRARFSLVGPDVSSGPGRALPDAGRAPLTRQPRLLVVGPDDATLVGFHAALGASVARVEPDGRVAWVAALPPGRYDVLRIVAIAMGADSACAVSDSSGSLRLDCFDARSGARTFDSPLQGSSSRVRLGVFADAIHVVDFRRPDDPQNDPGSQQLRVFSADGTLRLRHDLPLGSLPFTLSPFGPAGELVATWGEGALAIAPDGTLRWRVERSGFAQPFVAGDGGALLVATGYVESALRLDIARLDATGSERWHRTFFDASVNALGPDWLVREATATRRIADADGADRWVVSQPASGALRAVASDGSAFVDGAEWRDGSTGARVDSIVDVANQVGAALHRFDSRGQLLRLVSQLDERSSSLTLERFRRDAPTGPRARLAATGFWHAPSVPGQGFALAVDARSGGVEGRWLTFGPSSTPRVARPEWATAFTPYQPASIDAQRWYRLAGRTAVEGDTITMRVEAPGPTGFDGGAVAWRTVGSVRWRMRDCTRVELDYELADGELVRSGFLALERFDGRQDCEALPGRGADVDAWSADGDPGRALVVAQARDGAVLAAWSTFVPAGADAGRPHWLTLQGEGDTLRIERTLAGGFATGATRNTLTVGSAMLTRISCDRLAIDYRFDADEVAAPFDGRSGRFVLQRRGRCPR